MPRKAAAGGSRPHAPANVQPPPRDFYVGGQAVVEGVMMRGPSGWAVSVRKPDGEIETRVEERPGFASRHRWARIPFVRGSVALAESMAIGMRALFWAANQGIEEDPKTGEKQEIGKGGMVASIVFAIVFFLAFFVMLPTLTTRYFVDDLVGNSLMANLFEGLFRVGLFLGYVFLISLMPDIRRVFQYHGAEHKTIAAYEYGDRLVPEAVARYSTRHVRCGTNFLLIVMVLAVLCYSFLGRPPLVWRILSRIALIPAIAGLSYEVIRLGAQHMGSRVARIVMAPGLALQGLTTREPDREQIEVAITSLRAILPEDERDEVVERPLLPEAVKIPA